MVCLGKTSNSVSDDDDIKNNASVIVNNDFLGHEWDDLPKIVIHGNERIFFHYALFMSWTQNSAKTIIDRWFRHGR